MEDAKERNKTKAERGGVPCVGMCALDELMRVMKNPPRPSLPPAPFAFPLGFGVGTKKKKGKGGKRWWGKGEGRRRRRSKNADFFFVSTHRTNGAHSYGEWCGRVWIGRFTQRPNPDPSPSPSSLPPPRLCAHPYGLSHSYVLRPANKRRRKTSPPPSQAPLPLVPNPPIHSPTSPSTKKNSITKTHPLPLGVLSACTRVWGNEEKKKERGEGARGEKGGTRRDRTFFAKKTTPPPPLSPHRT